MSNNQQSYCRTPGGLQLSLHKWGEQAAPQLLLVHGFGDNALVWNHFATNFTGRRSVLGVDLRGHGGSSWDPSGGYALADFVTDVVHVLEQVCHAPLVLIGHSLGAHVAIRAAAARPELIRALVVVDCAWRPKQESAVHVRRKFSERRRAYQSPAEYVEVLRQQLPLSQVDLLATLAHGALRRNAAGLYEDRSDPRLANMDDTVDTAGTLAAFKQVERPILLVRGEGSAILSRSDAAELLNQVPQLRTAAVGLAGHTVMLDNPEGFGAVVQPYVSKFCSLALNVCDAS